MEIEYVKELDGRYMLIRAVNKKENFEERMLTLTYPSGLLPFRIYEEQPRRIYSYEISDKKSLASLAETKGVEVREICGILEGLYLCLNEMEEHLLDPDSLLLKPGTVWLGEKGWLFSCLPGYSEEIDKQIQELSRYFLRKCNHEDEATEKLAYELFEICHEENFSFPQIISIVDRQEAEKKERKRQKRKGISFLPGRRKKEKQES